MSSQADTPVGAVGGAAIYRFWVDDDQLAHIRKESIKRFWNWMLKKSSTNTTSASIIAEGRRTFRIGERVHEIWGDSQVREAARKKAYLR